MKDTKLATRIAAAGICLLAGIAVRADDWPESKVRALERRALEAVADLALVPPPLNTNPGPEYGSAKERWAMNNGAALTPKGRLWASWIGGGDSPDAYTVCAFSDDNGETWNPPALVVDGHDPTHLPFPRSNIIANLWTDPAGKLHLFVSQSMWHNDGRMGVWETVCANPDDAKPAWSPIRRICDGAVLNKPIVLKNGTWLLPVEAPGTWKQWVGMFGTNGKDAGAFALASTDGGKTWARRGGVTVPRSTWPEPHFLELKDGTIRMYMRSHKGLRMAESHDEGRTWGEVTKPAGMDQPSARCQVRALASGNWIFVKHLSPPDSFNENKRIGLIAYLSHDEGKTWEGGLVLDDRWWDSYPDVEQGPDGTIYVTHDFERGREAEIYLHKFTEADILAKKFQSPQSRQGIIVMKAMGTKHNQGKQN
ncbi:MAG: exo-alpha-sialidase [Kiritimatiellae bacterium]|nr:exo-alpha-sialidase [Kiritimatiellia bacterium]